MFVRLVEKWLIKIIIALSMEVNFFYIDSILSTRRLMEQNLINANRKNPANGITLDVIMFTPVKNFKKWQKN